MTITKHGYARFKQRQKLKNQREMIRKVELAKSRGTLIVRDHDQSGCICIEYAGNRYILSNGGEKLVTTYPINLKLYKESPLRPSGRGGKRCMKRRKADIVRLRKTWRGIDSLDMEEDYY